MTGTCSREELTSMLQMEKNPRINQNKIKPLNQIFMNSIVYIIGAVVVVVVILKALGLF